MKQDRIDKKVQLTRIDGYRKRWMNGERFREASIHLARYRPENTWITEVPKWCKFVGWDLPNHQIAKFRRAMSKSLDGHHVGSGWNHRYVHFFTHTHIYHN